jgi:poly(A) polymerase
MLENQDGYMRIQIPDLIISRQPGTYLVGGCVRDFVQGLTPRDFDIAVPDAPRAFAEEIAARLGGRVFILGKDQFTVFCVTAHQVQIDIMAYKGSNIQEDILNRDFTINALACRLSDGLLVDVTGGVEDLQRRIVRMVSPKAFQDDPVRMVRAFRMAAVLNFRIEAETLRAIRTKAILLQKSAPERIWAELQRILACPDSHQHLWMMNDTNILPTIFPELVEDHPGTDGPNQTIGAIRSLEAIIDHPEAFLPPASGRFVKSLGEERRILLKTALLLRDIGKPLCRSMDASGRIRHHGHAARGAELAQAIGRRLRMSRRHREWIASLVRRNQRPLFLFRAGRGDPGPPPRAVGRFFRQCGAQAPHLLVLSIAGSMAGQNPEIPHPSAMTGFLTDMLELFMNKIDRQRRSPVISGQDLIQNFNLPPSPLFGVLLRRVEELHLGGLMSDRKQALQWIAEQLGVRRRESTTTRKAGGLDFRP